MRHALSLAAIGCFLMIPFCVMAQSVVPEVERKAALEQLVSGAPEKTAGIAGLTQLGTVKLEGEFDSPDGRVMRAREIVFEPGAVVAVHMHQGRPGLAYILAGAMTEYRVGADGKFVTVVKQAGEIAFEGTGVVHWWTNATDQLARALVVDIVPEE